MIKNPSLLEEFEKQNSSCKRSKNWYSKADDLYEIALKLNSRAVKRESKNHLKMLIDVREKMKTVHEKSV